MLKLYFRFLGFIINRFFYTKKIKSLKLEKVEQLNNLKGYNLKFIGIDSTDKKWLLKICHSINGEVSDICEREEIVHYFGRLFNLPIIHASVFPMPEKLKEFAETQQGVIQDKCILMPYIDGQNLADYKGDFSILRKQNDIIISVSIFYHWLGDEDRGTEDVALNRASHGAFAKPIPKI